MCFPFLRLLTTPVLFFVGMTGAHCLAQGQLPDYIVEQQMRESGSNSQRRLYDDLQSSAHYWYESRNPANLTAMDEALAEVLPEALRQAPSVHDFQSWEEAHKFKAYHDAGAVLLAKCYTLLYYGDVVKAAPSIELLTQKFPYAMSLERDRTVHWVRDLLRYHEHMCAMYGAIVALRVKKMTFPPERDEFDGPAQRLACRHMAILRLREGNYDAVERFAEMADTQHLRTSSGDWVINLIFKAMQPLDGEEHSEAAWLELRDAIKTWQAKRPKSVYAKMAEASFLYYWSWHATQIDKTDGYANFRERSDQGRKIMESLPRLSPAWYSLMLGLLGETGAKLVDMAKVFRDGNEKFPDYSPLYHDLCVAFARSGENGGVACAGVIHHLVGDSHPEQAARVLWRLCYSGDLATVQARLDMDDIREAIEAALVTWPDSLELRSDMGFVAITLGQKDLARTAMQGMSGKWNRVTWKGREDLAKQLCVAKARRPLAAASPLPLAKP
ncbi:MAG: hypothetical protein JWO94_67 [Verrucomicrobiaceae bacterium]|nr:hypothetical protein [Verrucomicrobiaceae bacterium]